MNTSFLEDMIRCDIDLFFFLQFEDGNDQTIIKDVALINPKTSNNTNNYKIHPFEVIQQSNDSRFSLQIKFERNYKGIGGIIINYHLMCTTLVLVASINFLIDPKVVPGRAGMLVTLFLVLANFFSGAQVVTKI